MRKPSALPGPIFVLVILVGFGIAYATSRYPVGSAVVAIVTLIVALVVSSSIKVANQWEKVVVFSLGRFRALEGPGLFFIIPIIETVAYWIDTRVITAAFKAEKTLTKDTVPVDVDAVLFWKVVDPKRPRSRSPTTSRDQLGVADRAARHHRQDHARRHARGPGEDQRRVAEDHRYSDRAVGRQRDLGRGQGCADPAALRTRCRCRRRPSGSARRA